MVTPSFPPDSNGVANYCYHQAKALSQRGVRVQVLTAAAAPASPSSGWYSRDGIDVMTLNISGCLNITSPLSGQWRELKSFIRQSSADVLLCHAAQTWATDVPLLANGSFKGVTVYHSHCISSGYMRRETVSASVSRYLGWMPYRLFQKKLMLRADAMLALAEGGVDNRCSDLAWFRASGKRVGVVGSGYNPAFDAPASALEGASSSRISSFLDGAWLKGFDTVLEAYRLSELADTFSLHLYVHQMTEWSRDVLRQSHERGLPQGSVVIHEGLRADELVYEYHLTHCVLSASRTECLPLVLLDCVGAVKPFVALDSGHICSIPGGVVVSDVKALADGLRKVCLNVDGLRDRLISKIQSERSAYSWSAVAQRTHDFLKTLV